MIPKENSEFTFVRRNGSVAFESGIAEPWTPLQNDPLGPAEEHPSRDKHLIAMLESIPLNHRAVTLLTGTRNEMQDVEHLIRLIKWLNEMERYTRFSYHLTNKSFSIQRFEGNPAREEMKPPLVKRDESALTACPICNMSLRVDNTFDFKAELKALGHPRWNHNVHLDCYFKFYNASFRKG